MGIWTLEHVGGLEQSFPDWGFTMPRLEFASQGRTSLTVRMPGVTNLVAVPPIPFEDHVILRRNRTVVAGVFSGGQTVFQGRQVTRRGRAIPAQPADMLTFADAWYDL